MAKVDTISAGNGVVLVNLRRNMRRMLVCSAPVPSDFKWTQWGGGRNEGMLSNFGSKKPEKEPSPVNAAAQTSTFGTNPSPSGPSIGARSSQSRQGNRAAPSVIGPDLTIMGNLISSGEVQVDGEVQGDLHGTHIVIGEKARITGGVNAEEVVVRGHVMGSIRGRKVMLQSSSHVEGDVHHESLAIEQGAYFEGKSRRSDDPLSGVQRPEPSSDIGAVT